MAEKDAAMSGSAFERTFDLPADIEEAFVTAIGADISGTITLEPRTSSASEDTIAVWVRIESRVKNQAIVCLMDHGDNAFGIGIYVSVIHVTLS